MVEDNAINRKAASIMLEKMGYSVDCVVNGKEAVAAVASSSYGLVFMDCQMPEMDGFEATRSIRASDDDSSEVTIVALTANAMKGDRERCLEAGMDDYLTKPVVYKKLNQMVQKWLARHDVSGLGSPVVVVPDQTKDLAESG